MSVNVSVKKLIKNNNCKSNSASVNNQKIVSQTQDLKVTVG